MKISVKNIEKRTRAYSFIVSVAMAIAIILLIVGTFLWLTKGFSSKQEFVSIVLLSIGGCLIALSSLGVVLVDIQSLLLNLNNGKELYFADKEKE